MAENNGEHGEQPEAGRRRFEISEVGDVKVARLRDPTISDGSTIQELAGELMGLIAEGSGTKLLVNFSEVEILAPAAVAKLLLVAKKVKANSGRLKLSNLRPAIYDVFRISNLTAFFEIAEDEAEALASF